MSKTKLCLTVFAAIVFPIAAFAVDGVTLINQSTVQAAGGFPYQITQTGSYRLSGNLVSNGKTAISINATNVTLDLNGFMVSCTGCSGVPGISSDGVYTTILNGTVSGFVGTSGSPFGLLFQAITGNKVDRVEAISNGEGIVSDAGADLTVTNSSVLNSAGTGLDCGGTLTVINSIISGNAGDGIHMVNGLVTGSTIAGNAFTLSNGFRGGIGVFTSANITNNTIINNNNMGIFTPTAQNNSVSVGVGLNTFHGQTFADMFGPFITSMKNNVCSNGSVC